MGRVADGLYLLLEKCVVYIGKVIASHGIWRIRLCGASTPFRPSREGRGYRYGERHC
jgi:hypothetical protein